MIHTTSKLRPTLLLLFILCTQIPSFGNTGAQQFQWPNSTVAQVYRVFLDTYNTGSLKKMKSFASAHHSVKNAKDVDYWAEYWMDFYHRFGPLEPRELSINKDLDLEVWLQGKISKTWIALELILHSDSHKIRATGNIMGMQPAGTAKPAKTESEMLALMKAYLKKNSAADLFQGNVLFKKGSNILIEESFGYADRKSKTKNNPATRMRVASITKTITAVAVLQLVQQNKLSLFKPVSSYLPDYPKHIADQITIHDLLTHTSGYELDGIDGFREELKTAKGMADVASIQLKYLPEWEHYEGFEKPTRYDYSNDDFDLLAIIVERVSGLRYEDYLKQNIFKKAGMKYTSFGQQPIAKPYRYDISVDDLKDYTDYYPSGKAAIAGGNGLVSTTRDLARFMDTLLNSYTLLDLAHRSLLFAPQVSRGDNEFYAYGSHISHVGSLHIGHSGSDIGTKTEMRYFPEEDYTLIVLTNDRNGAKNFYEYFRSILPQN